MKKPWLWLGLIVIGALISYSVYVFLIVKPDPPIFQQIEALGYTPNIGFSGIYAPGNHIQITERNTKGEEQILKPPMIFLWADDCFPNTSPRKSVFVLPESKGRTTTSLNIGVSDLLQFLPTLQIDNSTVVDYQMELKNPQLYTYSKADLSRHYSQKCVTAFTHSLDGGDKIEWYAVINEAIVAESLRFEIQWRSGTSLDARNQAKAQYLQSLSTMLGMNDKDKTTSDATVEFETDTEKNTVLQANKPVIVGYRFRPIYVVE